MILIAMVSEAKEISCIFVPSLSVTVHWFLLLKCSHPDHQQQATSDSKLTGDLAASTDAAKVRVSDGCCAYACTSLVHCVMFHCLYFHKPGLQWPRGMNFLWCHIRLGVIVNFSNNKNLVVWALHTLFSLYALALSNVYIQCKFIVCTCLCEV